MDLEKQLLDGVEMILGKDGLASRQAGFRFNEQQFDYARRTAIGFSRYDSADGRTSITLLQAATGLGKTIAYLIPAMLFAAYTGKRIAVSTFTRHLQRQIVGKDAVLAAEWVKCVTGVALTVARRVGRMNYVSEQRCASLVGLLEREDAVLHEKTIDFLQDLIDWIAGDKTSGILDDFLEERALVALPAGLSAGDIGLTSSSTDAECRSFHRDIAASKNADVVVVNHALMVLHAYRWAQVLDEEGEGGRPIALAVFDEADRLADAATSILSSNVPLHKLLSVAQRVSTELDIQAVVGPVQRLYDLAMLQSSPSTRVALVRNDEEFGLAMANAASVLAKTASLLTKERDLFSENIPKTTQTLVAEFLDTTNDLLRTRDAMDSSNDTAMISWSPVKAYPSLLVGSPNAGRVLSRLWSHRPETPSAKQGKEAGEILPNRAYLTAALFTSATLATPGRRFPEAFDDFSRSVGIVRNPPKTGMTPIHNVQLDLLQAYQPRKFGKMSFVLADPRVPAPTLIGDGGEEGAVAKTDPLWLEYCATVVRTAHATGRRVLVLTLSWNDTRELGNLLASLGDDLLVHGRGEPLRGVLAQFSAAEHPNAVLISPGAWEGVDLPGLVNNLVVTRIPFTPPNQPEHERLRLHMKTRGYSKEAIASTIRSQEISTTRRRLEQGIGRGLRSPTDETTVWIADPRFPLPESFSSSLDEILLAAPARPVNQLMRSCIPSRFMDNYSDASLCLQDGTLHHVI